MAGMNIEFKDNSKEVLQALATNVEAALEACGHQAVSHAKQNITKAGRIDTSNMINSVNHMVQGKDCYVGTNVEYAVYNELGTGIYIAGGRQTPWAYQDSNGKWHWTRGMKPIHFLKYAISNHINEYKRIIEQQLKK